MRLMRRIVVIFLAASPAYTANAAPTENGADDAYWQTHSVVYASIVGTTQTTGEKPKTEIALRPTLRLSGRFDPGKLPEVSAEIDPASYGANFKMPAPGVMVLVVLEQKGDAYLVPRECPNYFYCSKSVFVRKPTALKSLCCL